MKITRTVLPPSISGGGALTSTFISVADAAKQVFGDATYDSTKLTRDISAVYYAAERYMERAILTQTIELTLDKFPAVTKINPYSSIYLPYGKLQSVASVTYTDEEGNSDTLVPNTDYTVDSSGDEMGIVSPTSAGWPTDDQDYQRGTVKVTYNVGYGVSLPDDKNDIKVACLLALGDLYETRQNKTPMNLFDSGLYDQFIGHYKIYFNFHLYNDAQT